MLAGKLASARAGPDDELVIPLVRRALRRGNMARAANPDITSYPSFNQFFTRPARRPPAGRRRLHLPR